MRRLRLPVVGITLLAPVLSACTQNADSKADERRLAVTSSADGCSLSARTAPAGTLTFDVTNTGSQVTEFYLLASDGLRIVSEVENIGPSLSRQMVVNAPAGTYVTACKPGMKGDGIRAAFTVTPSTQTPTVDAADQELVTQAARNYAAYVQDQSDQLLAATERFVALYEAGRDDAARAAYPAVRMHYERIEPVAESFGDLDPKLDLREADVEAGARWTGWHRIEKDLWPPSGYVPLTTAERRTYGADLLATTRTLDRRVQHQELTVDAIANGSRGLLEEVARSKVTGEEETWSHTDLWDFAANVEGAKVGYDGVREIVRARDPALAEQLDARFAALQRLLRAQRDGAGYRFYDRLSHAEVRDLAAAVNALSEPLSQLTAVVLS